jgi:predicted amidohydrolase YtcJ
MLNRLLKSFFFILLAATLSACSNSSPPTLPTADLVLSNGKIFTMNPEQNWAEAIVVADGRIAYVGSNAEATEYLGDGVEHVDLNGQMVLPSFQDVHIHPISAGVAYTGCPLFDLPDLDAVLAKITQCSQDNPDADLIQGRGWSWGNFIGTDGPDKKLLDAIDETRPLLFGDSDGHTLWLNSSALEFAGINSETADPDGGEIGRVSGGNEPNGTLLETAMELMNNVLPPVTPAERVAGLRYAQNYLNSLGITAIQDAYVRLISEEPDRSLDTYTQMRDKGELNLRVSAALYWEPDLGVDQIPAMLKAREQYEGGRLRVSTVKFWADGILESHTAKMLEPYTDKPGHTGLLMVPREDMLEAAPLLDAQNFQIHIHAIGDATVRYGLDALEAARDSNGVRDSRHLTAHTQIVNPLDMGRFAQLDVIAGFSPLWFGADEYIMEINPPQVGAERMQQMYPIKSILNSGGRVAFGSDWYVTSPDPLLGIEAAVTRIEDGGDTHPVFIPAERISLIEAIAGYTSGAAYANFLDQETGTLEVGKYADLVILDKNLFDLPASDISSATVTATLLEGELVHGEL